MLLENIWAFIIEIRKIRTMSKEANKLSKRQPIEELAFHKEQCEINGVQFDCHQSYYEGELLNGVDLRVKEVSGLQSSHEVYAYLQDSQQIVFCASSHLMVYNTHRRTHHQLLNLSGQVRLLRTHLQKMNNRQYIIWVESNEEKEPQRRSKIQGGKSQSKLIKKTGSISRQSLNRVGKRDIKSIFSVGSSNGKDNLISQDPSSSKLNSFTEKRNQAGISSCSFKVFDYTKKQFVYQGLISISQSEVIKDVFVFWNHYKLVGYVTQNYENNQTTINYLNVDPQRYKNEDPLFSLEKQAGFNSISTTNRMSKLIFNNEQNHYIFFDHSTLRILTIREDNDDADHELFKQFLNFPQSKLPPQNHEKSVRLQVEESCNLDQQIVNLAINDQYLAVLTTKKIYFLSAYDLTSSIFSADLQNSSQPLKIEFNKASVMVTYKNTPSIFTYAIRNKVLTLISRTDVGLNHCKQILEIYTNSISSEVFCVVLFYQLQGRDHSTFNTTSSLLQNLVEYVMKPAFVDIVGIFLAPSARAEPNLLGIAGKHFKRVHTCPWLSSYVVETEQGIWFKQWRQSFQNKKCVAIHPTGLFLVVCLRDNFKIYIITFEGFVNTYRGDAVKDIQSCSISQEGNHLAIASQTTISVYDFYSCSKIRTITLPFGITIQSVEYSRYSMVCCLKNKKVYLYDPLNEYKQLFSFNPKVHLAEGTKSEEMSSHLLAMTISEVIHTGLGCIYYDPILNFFIYSYATMVYFFNSLTQNLEASIDLQPLSCIHYNTSLRTLFLGTENGEIICFAWPNKPINLKSQQRTFKMHGGKILDIRVTSDLRELITVGQDESLCVSGIIFAQNLKKFEGLELVEHLSGNIHICYDFLSRKGIHQYTHHKFGEKSDALKDCEEQVLNLNFILPEERQKQKEQMLLNVKQDTKVITDSSSDIYKQIQAATSQARDIVSRVRSQQHQFERQRAQEKQQLRDRMYKEYIQHYNRTQYSLKEIEQIRLKNSANLIKIRTDLDKKLNNFIEQCDRKYVQLQEEEEAQQRGWKREDKAEIGEIDEQKRIFIEQNLNSLNGVLTDINNSNGILACRNNNLEKEIAELRRKLQEQRYLHYRLQGNTKKLLEEQAHYEELKGENKRVVEKEDKINLTEIEKRYVKQTQKLIERDKEINVQLVNHAKEKNILIHLQRCVEEIQTNIEQLVEAILQEKKDRNEDNQRIALLNSSVKSVESDLIARKKQKISSRNQLSNFVCKLESAIEEIVNARTHSQVLAILQQCQICEELALQTEQSRNQEDELLNKIISQRIQGLGDRVGSRVQGAKMKKNNKSYRILKTEGEDSSITKIPFLERKDFATSRQMIGRKSKQVYAKLTAEHKQYERIKTEQIVFKNTHKKFNLENQDLIENYNSLAMQNKRFMIALKRQEVLARLPGKKEKQPGEITNPTAFQLYLQNKAGGRRSKLSIPSKVYEY